jgi:hypothetical protein
MNVVQFFQFLEDCGLDLKKTIVLVLDASDEIFHSVSISVFSSGEEFSTHELNVF